MTGHNLKEASDDETQPSCPTSHHEKDEGIGAFFTRNGFDVQSRELCDRDARLRFPDAAMTVSRPQGYCSYTLALRDGHLLQYRPEAFKLDLEMCREAKAIYGSLAPTTTYLGSVEGISLGDALKQPVVLHVYLQERIPGIPFSEFRAMPQFADRAQEFRKRMLEDLAGAFALSFHGRRDPSFFGGRKMKMRGRVGKSMRWRLDLLLRGLPGHLQVHVSEALRQIKAVERSSWCLTHGDLLPGNMMVDHVTGHLTGLIDWAEAEWLPFGMALYGVEEVLLESADKEENSSSGSRCCDGQEVLRRHFWDRLLELSSHGEGKRMGPWVQEAMVARKLGILLWVGIAFDDGRIDRVVEKGRDDVEMGKLKLFLEAAMGPARMKLDDDDGKDNQRGGEVQTGLVLKMTAAMRGFWKRARVSCM